MACNYTCILNSLMPILSTVKLLSSFFVKMGCNTYGMKISLKKNIDILEYTSDVYYTKE